MNKDVAHIITLGKDSIVQLAVELIDKNIDIKQFSKITVVSNGLTVYVSFLYPIKYLPIGSVYYFDFGVDLIEKVVTYGPVAHGTFNPDQTIPLYKPTIAHQQAIQFVIDAINKSDQMDSIDVATFNDNLEIRAFDNHYAILLVTDSQELAFKIEKGTGKIYDLIRAELALPPDFETEPEPEFFDVK